ncbi:MAG: nucleotidyltransferase domain-containing protein [Spirochaetota bacterium]
MLPIEKEVLETISAILKNKFGSRVVGIYAFGSRVRGDFSFDSDFDVLIVVDNKTPEVEREIISIIVDEEMKYNLSFSPLIKDATSFEYEKLYHSPFYENVVKEGIKL